MGCFASKKPPPEEGQKETQKETCGIHHGLHVFEPHSNVGELKSSRRSRRRMMRKQRNSSKQSPNALQLVCNDAGSCDVLDVVFLFSQVRSQVVSVPENATTKVEIRTKAEDRPIPIPGDCPAIHLRCRTTMRSFSCKSPTSRTQSSSDRAVNVVAC